MLSSVLRYLRLPFVMLTIWALGRFVIGFFAEFSPRTNATFSVVVMTLITSLYFGAMSKSIGGLDWKGTALAGASIGVVAQLLIIFFTVVSLAAGLNTYYVHWDALNVPPETPITWGTVVFARSTGIVVNTIMAALEACLGRLLFAGLAPKAA
ncbi:hypothetical protein HUU05_13055 [candidate division KSB1 bacterium]|nr:hypothetical protein [candidate division KSB1 bacterium]